MKKLKYGIILLFSMILFSAPVLAAQTYYLPSKIKGDSYSNSFSYDKYGHLKYDTLSLNGNLKYKIESKWNYKYDKNGKRVSGEMYRAENGGEEKLIYELTFDKNQYLKSSRNVTNGKTEILTWNKDGYLVKRGNESLYKYYGDDRLKEKGYELKKRAYYLNGILTYVHLYNKDGLFFKSISKVSPVVKRYEYKYNQKGLVKTIIATAVNTKTGDINIEKTDISYSKIKTDKKTYASFINGYYNCFSNALL